MKKEFLAAVLLVALIAFSGCPQEPACGNGICEQGEAQSCLEDCNDTFQPPEGDIPLGELVSGVTLGGPLAGKQMFLLPEEVNIPGCWMDSPHWTGSQLFFGLTSMNFSKLISGAAIEFNPQCRLPQGQTSGAFDIYGASWAGGKWQIKRQSLNSGDSDAGISTSGNNIAYVIYSSEPKSWDIYFADRASGGNWGAPYAFGLNSACREDNPAIFAGGTKIIFESNRKDAAGGSCYDPEVDDIMKLWYSEKTQDCSWAEPVLLSGAPNQGEKNTQPWVDEENGYLYWTADKECGCIRRIPFDGKNVSGQFETVVTPSIASLFDGTADGKVVFVGEYSQGSGNAFVSCAIASQGGPYLGKWNISINLCAIPL